MALENDFKHITKNKKHKRVIECSIFRTQNRLKIPKLDNTSREN